MLGAIKYNLTHLLDFSGRDARQTFWFYVLFLFIANMVLGMILGVVMIASLIDPVIDAAQSGASDQAMGVMMGAKMGGFMRALLGYSMASNVLMILLLAASFVRRLHDSNRSGWWGLLPVAAQVGGSVAAVRMMQVMQDVMTEVMSRPGQMTPLEMQAFIQGHNLNFYGVIGWIAPLVVIVFGVMDSTNGPNRYGAEPVRF